MATWDDVRAAIDASPKVAAMGYRVDSVLVAMGPGTCRPALVRADGRVVNMQTLAAMRIIARLAAQ